MSRLSHLSHLSPTFPQVWIEPVGKPVHNLNFGGESSPIPVPRVENIVPYPHQWTACGQLFPSREQRSCSWGERARAMWTSSDSASVIHSRRLVIPRSSPRSGDDPTLTHRGKRQSSPVSTGPTTTTTSITIDGIKSLRVMQQSSPHLPALRSKGDAQ